MYKKLAILVPVLAMASASFGRDAITEGDKLLSKGTSRQPLLVKVDDKGESTVFQSAALTPAAVQKLRNVKDETKKAELFKSLVSETEVAANEVADAKISMDARSASFKDEVAGKPAWWYYGYGWNVYYTGYTYYPTYYTYYYPTTYYYTTTYYTPRYTYYPRYTYWIVY